MLSSVPALATAFFMTAAPVAHVTPYEPPRNLPYHELAFLGSATPRISRKHTPERSARTQRRSGEGGDFGWHGGAYAL